MEGMAVDFQFDARGAQVFGDITSANIGRQLAIVLDNHVESAPVIRQAITGGTRPDHRQFRCRNQRRIWPTCCATARSPRRSS